MKNIIATLSLFLLSFNILSQVVISGQVKNAPPANELKIAYCNNLEWNNIQYKTLKPDEKGKFKVKLNINRPGFGKIILGDHFTDLFLKANDSLHVTFDYKKFDETLVYTGIGAAENTFMAADQMATNHLLESPYSTYKDAEQYLEFEEDLVKDFQTLQENEKIQEFSAEFRNYLNSYGKYKWIYPRWRYSKDHKVKHYFDFLKELNLSKPWDGDRQQYTSHFTLYLAGKNDSRTDHELPDGLTEQQKSQMEIRRNYDHRKNLYKDSALDYALTQFMKNHVGDIKDDSVYTKKLLDEYRSDCKNPTYVKSVEEIYNRALDFRPGKPAPDFTLPDIDGKPVALSSFKGKVVYIDFWATWCGPCMEEMPLAHDLMERFRNDTNVVFLYVNVRDNKDKWKQYMMKENMQGISLYANNSQSSVIQNNYAFRSIPRYVLIDKNGNLINTNAPRPGKAEYFILEAL